MATATKTKGAILISLAGAAVILGRSTKTVSLIVAKEVFTVTAPRGRGVGKPVQLFADEVECYAENLFKGEDAADAAVRDLRHRKGRLKK